MKKIYGFLGAAALLAMASCSDNNEPGDVNTGELGTNYMAVNIVNASSASRGVDDPYEDGIGNENKVDKVRFYFFDENGNAISVN